MTALELALAEARADSAAPTVTLTPEQVGDLVAITAAWNADRGARRVDSKLSVSDALGKILRIVREDVGA